MLRQIRTCIMPLLHDYVSFDVIRICKYLFWKPFKFENLYQINMSSLFSSKRDYVMRKEYIYIYTDYLKYFSNSNVLENGFIYIYLYISFRFIVLFLDEKIADRQTNNLSIPPNGDCGWWNYYSVWVSCDKFLISKNVSFSTN